MAMAAPARIRAITTNTITAIPHGGTSSFFAVAFGCDVDSGCVDAIVVESGIEVSLDGVVSKVVVEICAEISVVDEAFSESVEVPVIGVEVSLDDGV